MNLNLDRPRIDKRYVHKVREENVIISDIRRISTEPEEFECDMIVDPTHPFFFEHPLDHIPGMMFTEAGRQMGTAIPHLFLNVPFGTIFISKEFNIRFDAFAELEEPITIRARVNNRSFRHGALFEGTLEGEFYQCGTIVSSMHGNWKMFPKEVYKRFRQHEIHSTAKS